MAPLKLYFDLMSQPSRAVYIFLKVNNIAFEEKPIALRKGEHLTEMYAEVNPFQLVPVIEDEGFKLTESVAIMSYLCDTRGIASHWYPGNPRQRARVDEYMLWHQFNTRFHAAMVFRTQIIEPRARNIPVDREQLRRYTSQLETTLGHIENVFLKDQPYLCGDELTLADLLGICELMQTYATNLDVRDGHPVLAAWMERVKKRLEPHFEEAHKIVYAVRSRFLANKL